MDIKQSEINRIIKRGSAIKRVELLTYHTGIFNTTGEAVLSDDEFKTLFDSFTSNHEVKVYNKAQKEEIQYLTMAKYHMSVFGELLNNLNRISSHTLTAMRDYIIMNTFNYILSDIKDPDSRDVIIKKGMRTRLMYDTMAFDKKNNVFFKHPDPPKELVNKYKVSDVVDDIDKMIKFSDEVLISLKTLYALSRDYKSEISTDLKAYSDFFVNQENELRNYLTSYRLEGLILNGSLNYFQDIKHFAKKITDYDQIETNKEMYNEMREMFIEEETK